MADKKKRRFKLPILVKTAIMVFVFALAIVEIAMTYYSVVMSNRNQETAKNFTTSLSATVAETIDTKDYKIVHDKVDEIYSSSDDVVIDFIGQYSEANNNTIDPWALAFHFNNGCERMMGIAVDTLRKSDKE